MRPLEILWQAQALRAARRPQLRRAAACGRADLHVRRRFRRSVRGPRPARGRRAAESRRGRRSAGGRALTYRGLAATSGSTTARVRPGPPDLPTRPRAFRAGARSPGNGRRCSLPSICDGEAEQARRAAEALLHRHARRAPGAARSRTAGSATIETSNAVFNEVALPLDGRPLHADHRHAARALPLRRHPLVQHRVRPRRHHHRARDCSGSTRASRAACSAFLAAHQATAIDAGGRRRARQDPARDPAAARWPSSARCRSAATTAASTRRRCSSCWRACISSAPATSPRSGDALAEHAGGACAGSTRTATATATASSSIGAHAERGLSNQGWKDSHDSVFHADGRLAEGPIALCEVQGYVYAAKRHAARSWRRRSARSAGRQRLTRQAATLQQRFEAAFWCEELGTYALALDGDKQPCRVRTSNAGQSCCRGIAAPSVPRAWPTALMAAGFLLGLGHPHGRRRRGPLQPDVLSQRLGLAARQRADRAGLRPLRPERATRRRIFSGCSTPPPTWTCAACRSCSAASARLPGKGPTLYPVACSPQAWASAAPLRLPAGLPRPRLRPGRRARPLPPAAPARIPRSRGDPQPAGRRQPLRRHAPPLRRATSRSTCSTGPATAGSTSRFDGVSRTAYARLSAMP